MRVAVSLDDGATWSGHDIESLLELTRRRGRRVGRAGERAVRGGFVVRVRGHGLRAVAPDAAAPPMCAVGTDVRPARQTTSHWFDCDVPPGFNMGAAAADADQRLTVPVRISLRGEDFLPVAAAAATALELTYFPEPALRSLHPPGGPARGGTVVTVSGSFPAAGIADVSCHFAVAANASLVGGTARGGYSHVVPALSADDRVVVCAAPPVALPPGRVHFHVPVTLSFNGGYQYEGATPPLRYLYVAVAVGGTAPAAGPTSGGTLLRVGGAGFTLFANASAVVGALALGGAAQRADRSGWDGRVVHLGSAAAIAHDSADFVMPPFTPEGADGDVTTGAALVAINAVDGYDGDYVERDGAPANFSYYTPPLASSITPATGPLAGGSLVTLHGVGFDRLGELRRTPTFRVHSADGGMGAAAIGQGEGFYIGYIVDSCLACDLVVERGTTYRFEVIAPGHPFTLSTTTGLNFSAGELWRDDGVHGSRVERGTLLFTPSATTPDRLYYQDASNDGRYVEHSDTQRQAITVVDPVGGCRARVAVKEVVTQAAPQQNGTNVTLPDQIVSTTLRTESGDLVPIARSPTALTLRMPAAAAVGPRALLLSLNGLQFEASGATFDYHAVPVVSTVFPVSAPADGGTFVVVRGAHLRLPDYAPPLVLINGASLTPADGASAAHGFNFTLPALPPGFHEIRVAPNGVAASASPTGVTVRAIPVIQLGFGGGGAGDATASDGASAAAGGTAGGAGGSTTGTAGTGGGDYDADADALAPGSAAAAAAAGAARRGSCSCCGRRAGRRWAGQR